MIGGSSIVGWCMIDVYRIPQHEIDDVGPSDIDHMWITDSEVQRRPGPSQGAAWAQGRPSGPARRLRVVGPHMVDF